MKYQPLSVVLTHWYFQPTVVGGLILATAVYFWAVGWGFGGRLSVPKSRQIAFAAAIVFLALALLSPLDELSDVYLFSAHMVQHLMLVLLVAPLLTWSLPVALARRIKIHPLAAFLAFNVVFTFTHLPASYDATLTHESLHSMEHLAYIVTAMLTWLPILSPAKENRLPAGLQMLYLFVETLPMFLLGALLSLNERPLYAGYVDAPRIAGISAVEDQSLGGLLMWIGGSFFYLGALTIVFFRWANQEIGLDEATGGQGMEDYEVNSGQSTVNSGRPVAAQQLSTVHCRLSTDGRDYG